MVQTGEDDVLFTVFRVGVGQHDDVELKELVVSQAASDATEAIRMVKLWHEGQVVATGMPDVKGVIRFENLAIVMDAGSIHMLEVTCDLYNSDVVPDIAGKSPIVIINNPGSDIKAIALSSGRFLQDTTDANTDEIVGDMGPGATEDSVGLGSNESRSANAQFISNSLLILELDPATPVGSQGAATGTQAVLLRLLASATQNDNAANPREICLNSIKVDLLGDVEVDGLELWRDGVLVSTSTTVHRTTIAGGDPTNPDHHVSTQTAVEFVLTGSDRVFVYGESPSVLEVRGNTYALTSNEQPTRSLVASVYLQPFAFGSISPPPMTFFVVGNSGVLWHDNGDPSLNPDSHYWIWIDNPNGRAELAPQAPLTFTGTSFIP